MNNLEAYRQKPQDVGRQLEISTFRWTGKGKRGKLGPKTVQAVPCQDETAGINWLPAGINRPHLRRQDDQDTNI